MLKEEIIRRLEKSHPSFDSLDLSLLDESINYRMHNHVSVKCLIHDNMFHPELRRLLKGSMCPICANLKRVHSNRKACYKERFISKANELHNGRYGYSKVSYVNAHTPVDIVCLKCGKSFNQKPNDHLNGRGCPYCRQSKVELEIGRFLSDNGIGFIFQAGQDDLPWIGKLRIDFYLPDYGIAIECQGRQHFEIVDAFGGKDEYERIIGRDRRKNELCNENGVMVIYFSNKVINDYPLGPVITNKNEILEVINGMDKKLDNKIDYEGIDGFLDEEIIGEEEEEWDFESGDRENADWGNFLENYEE